MSTKWVNEKNINGSIALPTYSCYSICWFFFVLYLYSICIEKYEMGILNFLNKKSLWKLNEPGAMIRMIQVLWSKSKVFIGLTKSIFMQMILYVALVLKRIVLFSCMKSLNIVHNSVLVYSGIRCRCLYSKAGPVRHTWQNVCSVNICLRYRVHVWRQILFSLQYEWTCVMFQTYYVWKWSSENCTGNISRKEQKENVRFSLTLTCSEVKWSEEKFMLICVFFLNSKQFEASVN